MNQTTDRNEATGVVASMTGYGHGQTELATTGLIGVVGCEVRTVNSRFVDVQLRLADELRALEPLLRETAARRIGRGKVECRLSWRPARASAADLRLDDALLGQVAALQTRVLRRLPDAAPLSVAEFLQLQAMTADRAGADDGHHGADGTAGTDAGASNDAAAADPGAALRAACGPLIDRVFDDCVAARQREGARLAAVIVQQIDAMERIAADLRPRVPALLADARERLTTRLDEALPTEGMVIDRDETFARIRQEVALLALRGDVAEELDRLEAHLAEARQIVTTGGVIGKRLDFLSQELNREANTIASKAIGIAVTDAAVELKLAIEQLREQVQNLE